MIMDPQTHVHVAFQRVNTQRMKEQHRVITLLAEQDKIMGKLVRKYKDRAASEEGKIHRQL